MYVDGVVSSAAAVETALRDRVAFYGQLEHAKLLQLDRQLDLLDAAAPVSSGPLLASYGEAYAAAQRLEHELEALRSRDRDRDRELDLLRFQIGELEAAALEPGEDDRVAQERERLRHAEKLLERVSGALRLLSAGDEGGAVDGLRVAERLVSEAAGHDQALAEVAGRLASLSAEADDALSALQAYLEGLDLDPAHRDAVELRYDTLQALKRKYRLATSDELLAYVDEDRQRLAALETAEHDESELTKSLAQARAAAVAAATELSAARAAAAPGFAAAVEEELRELAMPHARFEVKLVPRGPKAGGDGDDAAGAGDVADDAAGAAGADLGAHGAEEAEFLFSANPGVPLRPLRDTASGGELSRAMLAIRSTVTLGNDVETLIFDEVDTGIGGVTASALGERLARLAATTQIVCITHLPQLVAFADRHFAITKVTDAKAGITQTVVQEVEGEARIAELCRMLGASPDDEAARSHALALLDRARQTTS